MKSLLAFGSHLEQGAEQYYSRMCWAQQDSSKEEAAGEENPDREEMEKRGTGTYYIQREPGNKHGVTSMS